jgi:hypothetical protein
MLLVAIGSYRLIGNFGHVKRISFLALRERERERERQKF